MSYFAITYLLGLWLNLAVESNSSMEILLGTLSYFSE